MGINLKLDLQHSKTQSGTGYFDLLTSSDGFFDKSSFETLFDTKILTAFFNYRSCIDKHAEKSCRDINECRSSPCSTEENATGKCENLLGTCSCECEVVSNRLLIILVYYEYVLF